MRPLSQQLAMMMPAVIATLLILMSATPLSGGALTYTPNIVWLMTLVIVPAHPGAWPRGLAFVLGLLQDMVFGTPLGSQALLSLLLTHFIAHYFSPRAPQPFRVHWAEAAAILLLLHLLLALLIAIATPESLSVRHLLRTGVINVLWYPLFWGIGARIVAALPDAK